ncbi:MAG: tetratricopeptide repeat protein, partial [Myxococcota bacterium]|nr:tetratricopeptide repeat protein [Myxococcota bacterium]
KAFDAGNYADARKSFDAATKKNASDYQAFYNLAMACEKLGDKPAAEAAYKSALTMKPDFDMASAALSALYLDEGRTDDALATGRAALAKHSGNAALHENVGIALAMRGEQDNAIHEFEEAIKDQPSEPMFHLTLAHWLNTWHVRGAAPQLEATRALVKDDYGMVASIGHEYRMAGEFEACVKTFERAIQMKDGGEVRTERALCRLGLKDEKGTLDDLQVAVAKEPTYAPGHYYLGGRFALAKRFREAAVEYANYLELAPNGSLSKQATERLKALQEVAKPGGTGARAPSGARRP